jgi:hypothetical protein
VDDAALLGQVGQRVRFPGQESRVGFFVTGAGGGDGVDQALIVGVELAGGLGRVLPAA